MFAEKALECNQKCQLVYVRETVFHSFISNRGVAEFIRTYSSTDGLKPVGCPYVSRNLARPPRYGGAAVFHEPLVFIEVKMAMKKDETICTIHLIIEREL